MKHSNVIIHDDDVDWRTLVPKPEDEIEEDDPGKLMYEVIIVLFVMIITTCSDYQIEISSCNDYSIYTFSVLAFY